MEGLPEKISILGLVYDVREVEVVDKSNPCYGEINYQDQVIKIDKGLTSERKGMVLMHEVLHGVLEAIGQNELNNDENAVQSIASALYHVLSSQTISF